MRSHEKRIATLVTMHAYSRPAGSAADRAFRERWLLNLPGVTIDQHDNIHVIIGDAPTVLWSAHTDTVADMSGSQRVHLDGNGILALRKPLLTGPGKWDRPVLGADDTAGVFILREMILAGVAGHYIFHYGEECGCIGSSALARECPDWFTTIKMAIAFDRQGRHDVITSQLGSRCCSDTFATALATLLHDAVPALSYSAARGMYTDTAEYMAIVPECTNLSVGYAHAHSSSETLDTRHVLRLLDAVIAADFSTLPIERIAEDPYAYEYAEIDWPAFDAAVAKQYDEKTSTAGKIIEIGYGNRSQRHECADCGLIWYGSDEICRFCGYDDGEKYWRREWNRDTRDTSVDEPADHVDRDVYLDRVYADVQAALSQRKP